MSDLNSVSLVGRLTRDAESRQAGETTILNMRLAVNSRKKVGGSWEDAPNFFDVTHFPRGDGLAPLLTKGTRIGVTGRLAWREWEKDGVKRQSTEIVANDVQLLDSKGDQQGRPREYPAPVGSSGPGTEDDDIPFAASYV